MMIRYILKDKLPVPEPDVTKWAKWYETASRQVAETIIGDRLVSTVFLGINHNFRGSENPILFETMVFMGSFQDCDTPMERYSTWEEAEAGHQRIVEEVSKKAVH